MKDIFFVIPISSTNAAERQLYELKNFSGLSFIIYFNLQYIVDKQMDNLSWPINLYEFHYLIDGNDKIYVQKMMCKVNGIRK